ncbi:MAG: radical SAM protein [Oscillospiraceae bacterium]|nr:radical SAM protein [Oscillospiraceae bacterium]
MSITDQKTIKVFQQGFNYSQDGRGNRLVLHLQGCNMHCPWCSNPEGMDIGGTILTEAEWLTDQSCPKGFVREKALDRSNCSSCDMPCTKRRQKGIRFSCKEYPINEILDICIRSKPMFFDGGGVTLTGGEISVQFDPVKQLLEMLGDVGIHRAIESNGSHPRMTELIPLVDQWIMDVKHYDDSTHKKWTGLSNRQVIETLRKVSEVHEDMLVRIPLIPGVNSDHKDAVGFAELFKENIKGEHVSVELLTYHEFGKSKWAQSGKEYTMGSERISPATVDLFKDTLRSYGIKIITT